MNRIGPLILGLLMLSLASGCAGHVVYASGPYLGRVVDADTQQPLVGAVVVAIWYREVPVAPHGPAVDYHDSLEVLTDTNGEFIVPKRTHMTLIGKIREPDFVIYFPAYAPYPSIKARPQGKEIDAAYEQKVFHIQLTRLKTLQERLEYARVPVDVDYRIQGEKITNLIRLVNAERNALGLQQIRDGEKRK